MGGVGMEQRGRQTDREPEGRRGGGETGRVRWWGKEKGRAQEETGKPKESRKAEGINVKPWSLKAG